jgi:acyl-CoA thioesterase FadM
VNLYLRLLWLWLATLGKPAESRLSTSRLSLRVWPNDLDLFAHVNNGRYLTLMDLGRLHIVMRSGLLRVMRERQWHAAAAAIEIRFRRPLKLWQRYELLTGIVDWDEHWFLFEQRFESAGKVYARALVKAQFRHRRERVPVATVLELVGMQDEAAPGGGRMVAGLAASVVEDD